jgi:hypothetical protein
VCLLWIFYWRVCLFLSFVPSFISPRQRCILINSIVWICLYDALKLISINTWYVILPHLYVQCTYIMSMSFFSFEDACSLGLFRLFLSFCHMQILLCIYLILFTLFLLNSIVELTICTINAEYTEMKLYGFVNWTLQVFRMSLIR